MVEFRFPEYLILLFVLAAFIAKMIEFVETRRYFLLVILVALAWMILFYSLLIAGYQFQTLAQQQGFFRMALAVLMVGLFLVALEPHLLSFFRRRAGTDVRVKHE